MKMRLYEFCIKKHFKLSNYLSVMPLLTRKAHKRSIIEKIYENLVELPRIIGAAATVWLKGMCLPSSPLTVANDSARLMTTLIELVEQ